MNRLLIKLSTFLFIYGSLLPALIMIGMIFTWNAASAHLGHPPVASIDDPKEILDDVTQWFYTITSLVLISGLWLLPFYPFLFAHRLYITVRKYRQWEWYNRLLILMPIVGFLLLQIVLSGDFSTDAANIRIWFMD